MGKDRLKAFTTKTEKLASTVILGLLLLFVLYLGINAFFETSYISTANVSGELAEIYDDNIFPNLIFSAIFLAAMYLFYEHCRDIDIRRMELILCLWTLLFGLAFIASVKLSAPWYSDSYLVTYAGQRAARGDLSQLEPYFLRFPFQLGYVFYTEIFFRVFYAIAPGLPDGYGCLCLQVVNLLWLIIAYHSIIKVCELSGKGERSRKLLIILLFFCLPPVLSCTFLYGNIPAFGCGTVSLWMLLAFLKKGRLRYALLCMAAGSLSVMLKLNLLIFALAMGIVWFVYNISHFSIKSLICLILSAVCVLTLKPLPQKMYEKRCGRELGDGIPMVAWLAMGLSEGHAGPGWYKEDNTVKAFSACGYNTEATAERSLGVIKERLGYFKDNPREAIRFFSFKLKSQWNEPSYESVWINQVQQSYGEKKGLYNLLCRRDKGIANGLMNQYQQLIFVGVALFLLHQLRRCEIKACLLPLTVLGGMLYHLLFEAKSQYALSYFVLMVPMAAYGYGRLFYTVEHRKKTQGGKR